MPTYQARDYSRTQQSPRPGYKVESNMYGQTHASDSYERARQAVENARRELEERRKQQNAGPYSFVTQAPRNGPHGAVTQAPRTSTPKAQTGRFYDADTSMQPAGYGTGRSGYHTPRQTTRDFTHMRNDIDDDVCPTRLCPQKYSPVSRAQRRRKTLVIDLDETLVHSCFDPCACDIKVPMYMDGQCYTAYVKKRPGCDEFLRRATQCFDVIIWTASLDCYARPVLDELERASGCGKLKRMYRESCSRVGPSYIKDLSTLGKPLSEVAIVDNTPGVASKQPHNLIEVTSWYECRNDRELFKLADGFEHLQNCNDVKEVIQRRGIRNC